MLGDITAYMPVTRTKRREKQLRSKRLERLALKKKGSKPIKYPPKPSHALLT
jgi:hypothetical protein